MLPRDANRLRRSNLHVFGVEFSDPNALPVRNAEADTDNPVPSESSELAHPLMAYDEVLDLRMGKNAN